MTGIASSVIQPQITDIAEHVPSRLVENMRMITDTTATHIPVAFTDIESQIAGLKRVLEVSVADVHLFFVVTSRSVVFSPPIEYAVRTH